MFKLALRYALYVLPVLLGWQTWAAPHAFAAVVHQACPAIIMGCGSN